jgi:hypothetical protein
MLRNGHGRPESTPTHHRGGIGGGSDDNGTGHLFRAERILDETAQFAPALANQGHNADVAFYSACELGQEHGFTNARTRKKADSLPAYQR